jgi:ribose transport system permease protein
MQTRFKIPKDILKNIFAQREVTVFIIVILSVVVVSLFQPNFFSSGSLRSIALSVATDGFFSIGMCLALILGGIDLSVGGVAAMSCVITGYLCINGVNIWLACLITLAIGLCVGLFNGFMISKIGLPPFIVTLGMMNLSRGIAYIITTGSTFSVSGLLPEHFRFLSNGIIFGLPMLFVIFLTISIIVHVFTKKSNICRNIFYVGSNENAARFSGINVSKVKISVYVIVAILSTLTGILSVARFNVATSQLSMGAETTAVSAAVIGGTSFSGGAGSIFGTFMGIVLLKIVNAALVMLNISVYWQNFVQGAILILAVSIDYLSHREKVIRKKGRKVLSATDP